MASEDNHKEIDKLDRYLNDLNTAKKSNDSASNMRRLILVNRIRMLLNEHKNDKNLQFAAKAAILTSNLFEILPVNKNKMSAIELCNHEQTLLGKIVGVIKVDPEQLAKEIESDADEMLRILNNLVADSELSPPPSGHSDTQSDTEEIEINERPYDSFVDKQETITVNERSEKSQKNPQLRVDISARLTQTKSFIDQLELQTKKYLSETQFSINKDKADTLSTTYNTKIRVSSGSDASFFQKARKLVTRDHGPEGVFRAAKVLDQCHKMQIEMKKIDLNNPGNIEDQLNNTEQTARIVYSAATSNKTSSYVKKYVEHTEKRGFNTDLQNEHETSEAKKLADYLNDGKDPNEDLEAHHQTTHKK